MENDVPMPSDYLKTPGGKQYIGERLDNKISSTAPTVDVPNLRANSQDTETHYFYEPELIISEKKTNLHNKPISPKKRANSTKPSREKNSSTVQSKEMTEADSAGKRVKSTKANTEIDKSKVLNKHKRFTEKDFDPLEVHGNTVQSKKMTGVDSARKRVKSTKPNTEILNKHATELTPPIAMNLIEAAKSDPNFKKQLEGNTFESIFTSLPFGRFKGDIRNSVIVLIYIDSFYKFYDPSDPNTNALLCTGIAETAFSILKSDLSIKANYKPRLVSRVISGMLSTTLGISGTYHTALGITVGDHKYVLDWHKTLEIDDPMIYKYDDWMNGNDNKGVRYSLFINGVNL